MKKKMIALAMAMAFTAGTVAVAQAATCSVKSVQGGSVTLECKADDAAKLKVGDSVDVKAGGAAAGKKKGPEGC